MKQAMPVYAIKTKAAELLGPSISTSSITGLPQLVSGIWLSLNELPKRFTKHSGMVLSVLGELHIKSFILN